MTTTSCHRTGRFGGFFMLAANVPYNAMASKSIFQVGNKQTASWPFAAAGAHPHLHPGGMNAGDTGMEERS